MPKIVEIQEAVSETFGITRDALMGPSHLKDLVFARHFAFYLCRNFTHHSLTVIGQYFGGRDHTTVFQALKKMDEYMADAERVKKLLDMMNNYDRHGQSGVADAGPEETLAENKKRGEPLGPPRVSSRVKNSGLKQHLPRH